MPGSNHELDAKLRDYLLEQERDRAEGNTIANLRIEVHQVRSDMHEIKTEQRLMKLRQDRHGRLIREIQERINITDGAEMDTGQHQIEDLKRHLAIKEEEIKDHRNSSIWWRQKKREWAVAAVGALLMLTLGAVGTFMWWMFTKVVGK